MEKNISWADNLRTLATASVIVLHVAAPMLAKYGSIPTETWWIGNIYDGSVRFCVPVFLMLTGALMLSRTYSLDEFFKKRFSRIFLPLIFWSIIYIVYELLTKQNNGTSLTVKSVIKEFYFKLKDGASFHLWYIYMLVGIYLIFPVINKWIANATKQEISFYLVIWLLLTFTVIPIINMFLPEFDLRYFTGYLGYVILGYFLSNHIVYKARWLPIVLILAGIAITILGTFKFTVAGGKFYPMFYKYLSPNVIMTSIGVFLLFKNQDIQNTVASKIISLISKYSYGIYLSHILVLIFLSKIGINWSFINPILAIPITALLCLGISLALTYGISKIPLGNKISG